MKQVLSVIVGLLLGAGVVAFWSSGDSPAAGAKGDSGREPLYWVAPMDPDYRRDGPGKSPMGMDLVPVYDESSSGSDDAEGVVEISPAVVNNLGVRTARVTRGSWQSVVRTVGYVRYDEDRLIHIHPRVSGWIETLHVKAAGDPVVAGESLYTLYSPELVSAQEEYLLAMKRNNTSLLRAAEQRLRALQLSEDFIAALAARGRPKQTVTFHALQGGVVDELGIREGFFVEPGTTLMSIGQLDEVWVEAEVFERQAGVVEQGLPVTLRLDYLPGRRWRGRVDYVYPSLDPVLRTVRVRLRFANPDGLLKPNMFAQVVIEGAESEGVLSVPRDALIRTGNRQVVVRALGEGRFRSVPVTVGRLGEERVEILRGLESGDEVVVSAQFLLDSESSRRAGLNRMEEAPASHHDHGDMGGATDRDAMHSGVEHGAETAPGHEGMHHGAAPGDAAAAVKGEAPEQGGHSHD